MAIDSTELTFVRCPHCRSLVPAMSKVCRMCGEALDGAAKTEEPEKKSGRIRQRTMSRPQDELTAAATRLREENKGGVEATDGGENGSEEPAGADDPLGSYIEEVSVEEAAAASAAPAEPKSEPPFEAKVQPPTDIFAEADEHDEHEEEAAPEAAPERRVVVESGRKAGKPGGLHFGRREEAHETPKSEVRENGGPDKADKAQDRGRQAQQPPQQHQQDRQRHERRDDRRDEHREERRDSRPSEPARPAPMPTSEPRKIEGTPNRLFGWLVSYANPDGSAIELREGKFFVTGSNLKGNDLVIEDASVSTPHALVTVNPEHGFRVQDLMSDGGVFVRKRDGEGYNRMNEIFQVQHGDWLRFGNVEYLVSLIAHVGEK